MKLVKKLSSSLSTLGVGLFFIGANLMIGKKQVPFTAAALVVTGAVFIFLHFIAVLIGVIRRGATFFDAMHPVLTASSLDVGTAFLGTVPALSGNYKAICLIIGGNLIVLHFGIVLLGYYYYNDSS